MCSYNSCVMLIGHGVNKHYVVSLNYWLPSEHVTYAYYSRLR